MHSTKLTDLIHKDAENSVIAALLGDGWAKFQAHTKPEYFTGHNQAIYEAMRKVADANKPVDLIQLKPKLGKDAFNHLLLCLDCLVSESQVLPACSVLYDYAMRRALFIKTAEINKQSADTKDNIDVAQILTDLQDLSTVSVLEVQTITDAAKEALEALNAPQTKKGNYHIRGLNSITNGYSAGDLVVIAGRTGMGKTSFLLNLCEHIAHTKNCLICSLEMTNEQLAERLMSKISGISVNALYLNTEKVFEAACEISESKYAKKLFVVDSAYSLSQIKNLAKSGEYDVIAIDYLQLVRIGGQYRKREEEVANISKQLKSIAKECKITIFLLAQLNRQVEARADKRPQLSDLRESGAIEQDADCVLMLYRPEYYNETQDANGNGTEGVCHILVVKNRHGATGDAEALFLQGQIIDVQNHEPAPF